MNEDVQLMVRRVNGRLFATLELETEGGNRLTYTVPVSPNQTLAEIEVIILQTAKARIEKMLPTVEEQST